MPSPIIVSTWSFGQPANRAAWPILEAGGSALDAVEAACRYAEADPDNHTVGVGGYPDRDGQVSLDASIMLSPSRCGGVCAIRRFPHPISIARRVMEKTNHVLLAGEGAEKFAREQGFAEAELLDDFAKKAWEQWRKTAAAQSQAVQRNLEELAFTRRDQEQNHDTIGVLAIDARGTLAGGCSTSGLRFKLPGRVGDSPIVGHGLYVDPGVGAAVATGHGERVMGVCGTFLAVECLRRGASVLDAAVEVLRRVTQAYSLQEQDQVGIIVLSRDGVWRSAALRPGFRVAVRTAERDELLEPDHILLT